MERGGLEVIGQMEIAGMQVGSLLNIRKMYSTIETLPLNFVSCM